MPSRFVTFRVSLHEAIASGTFTASSTISVRGTFNAWQPVYFLLDNDNDGIFSTTIPIDGNAGDTITFKYVLANAGTEVWETIADRQYTLGPSDVTANASLLPHIFNTLVAITPRNLVTGERVHCVAKATLAPASPFGAYLYDNFVGWDGNDQVSSRGVLYAASLPATEALWLSAATSVASGSGLGSFRISINSLAPATTYHYRTFATNARGTSLGPIKSFTTSPAPVTGANMSATATESSTAATKSVAVAWTISSSPSPNYQVYIDRVTDLGVTTRVLPKTPASLADTTVLAGQTCEYFVGLDFGTAGRSAAVAAGLVTIGAWVAPNPPSGLSASSQLPGTVMLTWSSDASASFYEVALGQKILGQTASPRFLASHLPGHSYLSADEGGTHLTSPQFTITAYNGGGLTSSASITASVLVPLKYDGTANAAKVRPDRVTSRILLLAPTAQFASSAEQRTLQPSEPVRRLWAMRTSTPAAQFNAGSSALRSLFLTAEDVGESDWLLDNTVMSGVDRSMTKTLSTHTAPKVVPRYADANFAAAYSGHHIDGRKYQTVINARVYNDSNDSRDFLAEAYLLPGAHLDLKILFYTNFKGTILRIGGPTIYYRLFSKVGLYGAQAARSADGWLSMTQLINADLSQNFVKTTVVAGEEEQVIFRVRVPAFMRGSSTTLVVAAQRQ